MNRIEGKQSRPLAGDLSRRQFLWITGLFWIYVTLSNVLYAYGMRTGIAQVTNVPLFAPWQARVLQHLLLLPVLLICYRASLRIEWRPILAALPLQVILGLFFAALAYPAMIAAEATVGDSQLHHVTQTTMADANPLWTALWLASFVSFLPAYGFGLALVTGSALYAKFRNSELRRTALEREWSAARLAALRMQLSPHTLFNLLHTIRGYIDWDPKGAQAMVVELADLLRRLLNAGEHELSLLTDEITFARLYLSLQHRRFADRLNVILPRDESLPRVWVPSLILQPLIENAVVHGLAHHQGPVTVEVGARQADGAVMLRVTNTLAGDGPAAVRAPSAAAIGLKNVRERLAVQFDDRASLQTGVHGGLWVSEIKLPEIREP